MKDAINAAIEIVCNLLLNLMLLAIAAGVLIQLLPNANCVEPHTVRNVYIEAEKFTGGHSFFLPENSRLKGGLNLGLDIDMIDEVLFFDNKIVSLHDQSQFRMIGWHFSIGARLTRSFDLYYRHFSGHALDARYEKPFPFEDSVGIRWNLIGGK